MEEDPEVAPTPNPDQKPSKLTMNKNGKPRKQLDPEALERLAKAREKANAIRKFASKKKLEDKINEIDKLEETLKSQDIAGNQVEPPECPPDPQDIAGNQMDYIKEKLITNEEPEEEVKVVKKKVSKKKPVVIVEQSSDDEDEFEPNEKVLFVKRVSRKKKEKEPEPPPPPVVRQEAELPPPDIPKPKPINPLQRQYDAMFNGSFLNQQRRRF